MKQNSFFIFIILSITTYSYAQTSEAKKITIRHLKNLYQLNDSIYRSEQPGKKEFKALEELGIKTILSFRRIEKNPRRVKGTQLQLERLPLKASEIEENDIIDALQIIKKAEKPMLIHCWHGSDRTGVITAAYRIIFEDWSKEKAIEEFRRPEFGYHENWFPNLIEILHNLDVVKIRAQLGL